MKQVASLQYGVIFKKAFSQPDIFTAFVTAVLGIEFSCEKVERKSLLNRRLVMLIPVLIYLPKIIRIVLLLIFLLRTV
jgi:hypothetical protein